MNLKINDFVNAALDYLRANPDKGLKENGELAIQLKFASEKVQKEIRYIEKSLLQKYPDYDYPLHPDDEREIFYTRDGNLFVSGHTSNSRELIWFYYNELIMHEYNQEALNADLNPVATQTTYEPAAEGTSTVKLPTSALPAN